SRLRRDPTIANSAATKTPLTTTSAAITTIGRTTPVTTGTSPSRGPTTRRLVEARPSDRPPVHLVDPHGGRLGIGTDDVARLWRPPELVPEPAADRVHVGHREIDVEPI